ncbi:hypothetical protein KP78_04440 [Jeotgalibacillus soli]|uniref:Uncharacterized protein n=1 Tax=Jeotgalibacillus soli TaxID=889306 RepID=A0A0C2SDP4_9BACL|nr:hypothetical protein KP78_04440 [Jeotgalibacillus soli]
MIQDQLLGHLFQNYFKIGIELYVIALEDSLYLKKKAKEGLLLLVFNPFAV